MQLYGRFAKDLRISSTRENQLRYHTRSRLGQISVHRVDISRPRNDCMNCIVPKSAKVSFVWPCLGKLGRVLYDCDGHTKQNS